MAVYTSEVEIISSLSAPKLFKILVTDFDTIAPKADPQFYKSITNFQGDGGVGTIKNIIYGDGIPYTSSKYTIDSIDESNHMVSYTVFEGDALLDRIDTITHHIKLVPSADGGCVYKHTTLTKCKGDAKVTDDEAKLYKESVKNSLKTLESYAIAHPEAY